ncbi:MAG TPA: pyrroloquinoline quinone biosynthesis protein PqqE [Thermohalobaculum sp.]|nr:pyrroloquinoline quinone biosynthesis protein PqqE [Thermohalobaculum sp.]
MTDTAAQGTPPHDTPAPPMAMLAELTHRCPLACPYCSNPLELIGRKAELGTAQWAGVLRQAAELGVLQLHLSGGEPAARRDLEDITAAASGAGLYTNLITSGVGLTCARVRALAAAGLDHVQLSVQGPDAASADEIGGYRGGFARKLEVALWVGEAGLPLTLNAVMHRRNLDRVDQMIALACELGARRLEVACVQFHGWATLNRGALMPTRAQAARASAAVKAARERLKGVLVIDFVPPDHYARYPKACMGGWGSTGLNVMPDGTVLPCHAAMTIPGLVFERVPERALAEIWRHSAAFNAFRGEAWMQEPCRSCERRHLDRGGCRCQAMALAGDPAATDPTCVKSPLNARLRAAAEADSEAAGTLTYRPAPA